MKRFFRVVWRINSILICLTGFLLAVVLVYGLISTFPTRNYQAGVTAIQPSRNAPDDKSQLSIGKAEALDGTKIVRLTVQRGVSDNRKISSFSSGEPSGTCNYIFYDTNSNSTKTLFPAYNNFVADCDDFYFPDTPYNQHVLKWSAFVFADKDTNRDGVVDSDDQLSIGVTSADGEGFHVYLTGLDRVLTTQLEGENDLYVYYVQGKSVFVARIDLVAQKIVMKKNLF